MSQAGASAALKGYRVQALYTLYRILIQEGYEAVFQPEGLEDLDIFDANGLQLELVQIKHYQLLQLSHLAPLTPDSPGSFFARVIQALDQEHQPTIKLINFGEFGPEISNAWKGRKKERQSVTDKLIEKGFSPSNVRTIFSKLVLVALDEVELETEVYTLLRETLVGVDPAQAFDLLHYWLFLCMEKSKTVSQTDVIKKVSSVGSFLAERRDWHAQWFTTIKPLVDREIATKDYERLHKEFFEGGFTTYEHILAGLDFYREQKLEEIRVGFQDNSVVIIHAASGQGKTTLAYRYLYDYYPAHWRFCIQRIENIQHALSVANALSGHANALEAPMVIFVDVKPSDMAWPELIRQIATHPYIRVLVTIREEDFRRANLSGAEFSFVDIDLEFDENEARLIFSRSQGYRPQSKFLHFEDAWDAFGGRGPLLEFVYLLTQTTTLRQRLESQVNRIRDEVREKNLAPDELQLLCLSAVANAYEARLDTRKLINSLQLPEPKRTLEYYEKEYLIRVSGEERYIEGLHSIRSTILATLLTDVDLNPWLEIAIKVLPLLQEEDLENFILRTFVDRPDSEQEIFLQAVNNLLPTSWRGAGSVLQSLLWVGIRNYIIANEHVFTAAREEFGQGWFLIVDLNFSGGEGPNIDRWWANKNLSKLFSRDRIIRIDNIRASQTTKEDTFTLARNWLAKLRQELDHPKGASDWIGIAEVLYWAARFDIQEIGDLITDDTLDLGAVEVALTTLADVSFALSVMDKKKYQNWIERNHETIKTRLTREYKVVRLQEDGDLLHIHFLTTVEESSKSTKDSLHEATIERLRLVRQLFPEYQKYASQGYGHKLGPFELKFDSTEKTGVDRTYLVPGLVSRTTGIVSGLARYKYRPIGWDDYVTEIIETRKLLVQCLDQLRLGLGKYLERREAVNIGKTYINKANWEKCFDSTNAPVDLPQCAVDSWGFGTESISESVSYLYQQTKHLPKALVERKYRNFLKAQQTYLSSIRNFMTQAVDVTVVNYNLSKLPPQRDKRQIIADLERKGIRFDRAHLSTYNLWEAKQTLEQYQGEFRKQFNHLVESNSLLKLETQELTLLSEVWQLWYYYAHEPKQVIPRALHSVPRLVQRAQRKLKSRLQSAVQKNNSEDVRATLIQTELKWKGSPALWLQMDVQNPRVLYNAFVSLVGKLQTALGSISYQELDYYLMQEEYLYIVIVPTIKNRLLNDSVWALFATSTILNRTPLNDQNWISYIPTLAPTVCAQLALELWELPELECANKISMAVSTIALLTSQAAELADLPKEEVSDVELEVVQAHLNKHFKTINEHWQIYIDCTEILTNKYSSLSDSDKQSRVHLREAIATLIELAPLVVPYDWSDSQHLQLPDIVEYAQNLARPEVFQTAEYIRLCWIADLIDEAQSQSDNV